MLLASSSQPQQWLKLENNSENAAHVLADLFAVIIKLNWHGNVMFALISNIISSSTAIITVAIEWCWKYLGYLLNVCVFINFFFITPMCFSFLLEYDQAKSNESFETEKAVSYLMLNIRIENIVFFL